MSAVGVSGVVLLFLAAVWIIVLFEALLLRRVTRRGVLMVFVPDRKNPAGEDLEQERRTQERQAARLWRFWPIAVTCLIAGVALTVVG